MSWPLVKLGEVCKFVRGPFGGALKKECFVSNGYAVYEQQHAIYDQFTDIRYFVDEDKFNELKRFELNAGDLIMSCSGTMGKVAIVPENVKTGIINQALLKLTPSDKVYIHYLKYWLESESFQFTLSGNSHGAAIKNVASVSILKEIEIPLPPLAEQKRIAAILDKADAIRQKRKQAIELADEFLRSVFLDMFGDPTQWVPQTDSRLWDVKPIKMICPLKRGYDLPTNSRECGTIPIYAANGVNGFHNKVKVKGPGVITGRSGTIGRVVYSKKDFWPLNTALYVTDFFGNNPKYIEWFLKFYKLDRYSQGAGVPTLNRNLFMEELSLVPPICLQDKFVDICQGIENVKQNMKSDSDDNLFNSLSQKAFSGQL